MKSIEFITPKESLPADFRQRLTLNFGAVTERAGVRYVSNHKNVMAKHDIVIYEFAYPRSNLDPVTTFIGSLETQLTDYLEVNVGGEKFYAGKLLEEPSNLETISGDWPRHFDVAVQTVIGKELEAAQEAFGSSPEDATSIEGTIYYRGFVKQRTTTISVVICAQNGAGNSIASLFAERLISKWSPKAIFLMGICAGRKGKCKIGDVVTPRVIVNDIEGVMEAQTRLKRPKIYPPPHAMIQQLLNFRYDTHRSDWIKLLNRLAVPPPDSLSEVSPEPDRHESAIYSSDLLLRDASYLEQQANETHQQIRVGEMEAAGFSDACNARTTPVPWFVVRGVSDFGDVGKGDLFQSWAAFSAAAYLRTLIEYGINVKLF